MYQVIFESEPLFLVVMKLHCLLCRRLSLPRGASRECKGGGRASLICFVDDGSSDGENVDQTKVESSAVIGWRKS